jgi:enoyl-[acyl-carrier-protein] reductase (NADH)
MLEEDLQSTNEMRKLIHDISNQITSVMGFSFLIEMDLTEDSNIKDHVQSLNDSCQKCHAIIGAMQTSARSIHSIKTEMLNALKGQVTGSTPPEQSLHK